MRFLWVLCCCLLSLNAFAYETVVESDEVHYDGAVITLNGHVEVVNALGRVTAKLAVLKRDEEKRTKIDFPWIELKKEVCLTLTQGGVLRCDSLFIDYTAMTSLFYGNPQVCFVDALGEIYADWAQVDYQEIDGALEAKKITLHNNVRLVNKGSSELPASQYALADEVVYFPQEQLAILEGKTSRVLFYDQEKEMQLSARTVRAQRDPLTKKESVQGVGDVRFQFGPEEFAKIKQRIR